MLLVFQCAVVVTINTVAVSIIFDSVVNIASKTIVLDIVENFASVNILLMTIVTVSAIVAHQSEDYECPLSVSLSPV